MPIDMWFLLFLFGKIQVQDPDLTGVSHLLVDEIHERGMNEDFLLIILHDLLPRRPDLRLVLMSATINADLFSKYFGNAPTIHIPVLYFGLHNGWGHVFFVFVQLHVMIT